MWLYKYKKRNKSMNDDNLKKIKDFYKDIYDF